MQEIVDHVGVDLEAVHLAETLARLTLASAVGSCEDVVQARCGEPDNDDLVGEERRIEAWFLIFAQLQLRVEELAVRVLCIGPGTAVEPDGQAPVSVERNLGIADADLTLIESE